MSKYYLDANEIVRLYNSGEGIISISKKLGCSETPIKRILKESGVEMRKIQKFKGKIEDYDKPIIGMHQQGISATKIGEILKIDKGAIVRRLKTLGCEIKSTKDVWEELNRRAFELMTLYWDGNSVAEIERKTGFSSRALRDLFNDADIDTSRDSFRYTLYENYFDKIDCWKKAYLLGWLFSDGNNCFGQDGHYIRIAIQSEDSYVLEEMKKWISSNAPVYIIPANNENHKDMASLTFHSKYLSEKLAEIGCVPAKSLVLEFPKEEFLPKEWIPAFILGYFDGNGSIRFRDSGTFNYVCISSTNNFCDTVENYFNALGIYATNTYVHEDNKITSRLMYSRIEDGTKFLDHIYQGHEFCLTRKYDKYKQLIC